MPIAIAADLVRLLLSVRYCVAWFFPCTARRSPVGCACGPRPRRRCGGHLHAARAAPAQPRRCGPGEGEPRRRGVLTLGNVRGSRPPLYAGGSRSCMVAMRQAVNQDSFGGTFDAELKAKFPDVPYDRLRVVRKACTSWLVAACVVAQTHPSADATAPVCSRTPHLPCIGRPARHGGRSSVCTTCCRWLCLLRQRTATRHLVPLSKCATVVSKLGGTRGPSCR